MSTNRREFIRKGSMASVGITGMTLVDNDLFAADKVKAKKSAPRDESIVRVGYIGVGGRGQSHVHDSITVGGIEIVSICDISPESIERAKQIISKGGMKEPKIYTGSDHSFEQMLKNEELDAVIIATPWEWHVPMAIASMKAGVPYTVWKSRRPIVWKSAGILSTYTKRLANN